MLIAIALIFGIVFWYFYYGIECFMNGASGGYLMPFRCLWDDLRFNLPGGWRRRLEATGGDEEWARQFFGWGYILCTHVMIPFAPAIVAYLLTRDWN